MTIRKIMACKTTRCLVVLGAAATLSLVTFAAQAQENAAVFGLTLKLADPTKHGTVALSPAAKAVKQHGPLPFSAATAAAKAAANRASKQAEKSWAPRPLSPAERALEGETVPLAPAVVGGFNKLGLSGAVGDLSPPDTTGAIGPSSFVQVVNRRAGIFNRWTGVLIGSGTLNQLANIADGVFSTDPQVLWDPTTNRFYFTALFEFSASDNKLAFVFSKTAAPGNVTTDWCQYTVDFGARFPDFPKLGDSQFFAIIGVNSFDSSGTSFLGSDLVAISKPPPGTTCPAASTFKVGKKTNLVDSFGSQVFTPVPANQIDTDATGYVVAEQGSFPANLLWFFNVTRNATTGLPVFGPARGVGVSSYTIPPDATQPGFTQLLATSDARMTQAVQAVNPLRGTFSFWTQHTIASGAPGTLSTVRWYQINPVTATPSLLGSGDISTSNSFFFNAAISPDRRVDGMHSLFGSFVIQYNVSGKLSGINPRIVASSSVDEGPLVPLMISDGVGPYKDLTCPGDGETCRWGDYSAVTPDPRKPIAAYHGQVWGTNQFSGMASPPADKINWRTEIFGLAP